MHVADEPDLGRDPVVVQVVRDADAELKRTRLAPDVALAAHDHPPARLVALVVVGVGREQEPQPHDRPEGLRHLHGVAEARPLALGRVHGEQRHEVELAGQLLERQQRAAHERRLVRGLAPGRGGEVVEQRVEHHHVGPQRLDRGPQLLDPVAHIPAGPEPLDRQEPDHPRVVPGQVEARLPGVLDPVLGRGEQDPLRSALAAGERALRQAPDHPGAEHGLANLLDARLRGHVSTRQAALPNPADRARAHVPGHGHECAPDLAQLLEPEAGVEVVGDVLAVDRLEQRHLGGDPAQRSSDRGCVLAARVVAVAHDPHPSSTQRLGMLRAPLAGAHRTRRGALIEFMNAISVLLALDHVDDPPLADRHQHLGQPV